MAIPEIANIPVLGALPNIPKLYSSNPSFSFIIDMVLLSVVFSSLLAPLGYRIVKEKKLGMRFGAVLGLIFGVASAFALHNAGATLFTYWLTSTAVIAVICVVIYKIMRALGANKIFSATISIPLAWGLMYLWFTQTGYRSENVVVGFEYATIFIMLTLPILLIWALFSIFGPKEAGWFKKLFVTEGPSPTPQGAAPPVTPPSSGRQPIGWFGKIFGRGKIPPQELIHQKKSPIRRIFGDIFGRGQIPPPEPTPPPEPIPQKRNLISKIFGPSVPPVPETIMERAVKATERVEQAGNAAITSINKIKKVAEEGIESTKRFIIALTNLLARIDGLINKESINLSEVTYTKQRVDDIIPEYAELCQLLSQLSENAKKLFDYKKMLEDIISWHNTMTIRIRELERDANLPYFKTEINKFRNSEERTKLSSLVVEIENKITDLNGIINTLNSLINRINSQHLPTIESINVDREYAVLYDLLAAQRGKIKNPLEYASNSLGRLTSTADVSQEQIREALIYIKEVLTQLVTVNAPKLETAWEKISRISEEELKAIQKDVTILNENYKSIPAKLNEIRNFQRRLIADFNALKAREELEEAAVFEIERPPRPPTPPRPVEVREELEEAAVFEIERPPRPPTPPRPVEVREQPRPQPAVQVIQIENVKETLSHNARLLYALSKKTRAAIKALNFPSSVIREGRAAIRKPQMEEMAANALAAAKRKSEFGTGAEAAAARAIQAMREVDQYLTARLAMQIPNAERENLTRLKQNVAGFIRIYNTAVIPILVMLNESVKQITVKFIESRRSVTVNKDVITRGVKQQLLALEDQIELALRPLVGRPQPFRPRR